MEVFMNDREFSDIEIFQHSGKGMPLFMAGHKNCLQADYLLGSGPRLIKKNLPGRGLTKIEKHWANLMVTLHPFLADFLHWRTRRSHRPATLCRPCGHAAHARRPRSRQFLMGLRVKCIKMEEQSLLLETPLLKILL
jgi:hypothetical protein